MTDPPTFATASLLGEDLQPLNRRVAPKKTAVVVSNRNEFPRVELPVVVMILSKLGIVTPSFLSRNRKFAIVAIFIAAAVITPTPDAFTQCLMAVPMLFLYELSIWISRFVYKKGDKDDA